MCVGGGFRERTTDYRGVTLLSFEGQIGISGYKVTCSSVSI